MIKRSAKFFALFIIMIFLASEVSFAGTGVSSDGRTYWTTNGDQSRYYKDFPTYPNAGSTKSIPYDSEGTERSVGDNCDKDKYLDEGKGNYELCNVDGGLKCTCAWHDCTGNQDNNACRGELRINDEGGGAGAAVGGYIGNFVGRFSLLPGVGTLAGGVGSIIGGGIGANAADLGHDDEGGLRITWDDSSGRQSPGSSWDSDSGCPSGDRRDWDNGQIFGLNIYRKGRAYDRDKDDSWDQDWKTDKCTSPSVVHEYYLTCDGDLGGQFVGHDEDFACNNQFTPDDACVNGKCQRAIDDRLYSYVFRNPPAKFPSWQWKLNYNLKIAVNESNPSAEYVEEGESTFYVMADDNSKMLFPNVSVAPYMHHLSAYVFAERTVNLSLNSDYNYGGARDGVKIIVDRNPAGMYGTYPSLKNCTISSTPATSCNLEFLNGINKIDVYFNKNSLEANEALFNLKSDKTLNEVFKWIHPVLLNEADISCDNSIDDDLDGAADMYDIDCNGENIDCDRAKIVVQQYGCCGDSPSDFGEYHDLGSSYKYLCVSIDNSSKWVLPSEYPNQIITVSKDIKENGDYQLYSNNIDWLGCDADSNKGTFTGQTFSGDKNDLLCYLAYSKGKKEELIFDCDKPGDRIVKVEGTDGNLAESMSFTSLTSPYELRGLSFNDWSRYDYLEFDVKYNDNVYLNLNIIGANNIINVRDFLTGPPTVGEWRHVKINLSGLVDRNVTGIKFFVPQASFNNVEAVNVEVANYFYLTKEGAKQYCAASSTTGIYKWITDLDYDQDGSGIGESACEANSQTFKWTGNNCCGDDLSKDNYYADNISGCWDSINVPEGGLVNVTQ